jgi:hypothetical protein
VDERGQDDDEDEQEADADDPGEEELREGDTESDIRSAGSEVEHELTPAGGQSCAQAGGRAVFPHGREYDRGLGGFDGTLLVAGVRCSF